MISITNYLFENEKKDDEDFKMKHVGSGYGKWAGSAALGIPGMIAGHYIGKSIPDNPEAKFDPKKRLDRVGILLDSRLNAKRMAIGAGIGLGAVGLAALDPEVREAIIRSDPNLAVAAGITGMAGGMMVGGYKAAKKLGYGKVGRIMGTLTSLAGLGTPKVLKDKGK